MSELTLSTHSNCCIIRVSIDNLSLCKRNSLVLQSVAIHFNRFFISRFNNHRSTTCSNTLVVVLFCFDLCSHVLWFHNKRERLSNDYLICLFLELKQTIIRIYKKRKAKEENAIKCRISSLKPAFLMLSEFQ